MANQKSVHIPIIAGLQLNTLYVPPNSIGVRACSAAGTQPFFADQAVLQIFHIHLPTYSFPNKRTYMFSVSPLCTLYFPSSFWKSIRSVNYICQLLHDQILADFTIFLQEMLHLLGYQGSLSIFSENPACTVFLTFVIFYYVCRSRIALLIF